jgi:hypothetical protein
MLWRQGDVFIETADFIPANAIRQPDVVLADGEVTGHRHRVEDAAAAALFRHSGQMYLEVISPEAAIVHEEHGPIKLPRGTYRVWRQREYVPARRSFAGGTATVQD